MSFAFKVADTMSKAGEFVQGNTKKSHSPSARRDPDTNEQQTYRKVSGKST